MKTYAICYDLNSPGRDYATLIEEIKNFKVWWHHLDSTWIVKSSESSVAIRDRLKPLIDSNDELLVIALSGEGAWTGFKERGSSWLLENL